MPNGFRFETYDPRGSNIGALMMAPAQARARALREAGQAQARAAEIGGQATAGAINNIGSIIQNGFQQYQQQKADAPRREAEALQLQDMKDQQATAQAEAEREARRDAAFQDLLSREEPPDPREILTIYGPERGSKIAQGLSAFSELANKKVVNARDTAGRLAIGAKSMSPELLTQFWPAIRDAAINGGLGDAETIPEQPAPEFLDAVIGWAKGETPEQPGTREIKTLDADGNEIIQIVPDTPGQKFTSAPKPKPAPAVGSFEDFVTQKYGPRPSPEQIAAARRQYSEDGRAPRITVNTGGAGGSDASMPTDYRNALDRAIMSVPAVRRGSVIQTANRLWKDGNTEELSGLIRQAAIESENVDTKNQVLGRMATIAALNDTRTMLDEIKAAGVPTGWLSGNIEDLARKLGKSTDTRYVALSNRLMGTLINYRRAATGVQFSARESADYQRMFPNYRNELPVNLSLIDGLMREMRTYDKTYWEHKLGPTGAALIGAVPSDGATKANPFRK